MKTKSLRVYLKVTDIYGRTTQMHLEDIPIREEGVTLITEGTGADGKSVRAQVEIIPLPYESD